MNRQMMLFALIVSAGLIVGCDKKEPETATKPGTDAAAKAPDGQGVVDEAKAKLTEAQAATIKKYEELVASSEKKIADLKAKIASAGEAVKTRTEDALKPAEAELGKLKAALSTAKADGAVEESALEGKWKSAKEALEKAVKEAGDLGAAAGDAVKSLIPGGN
jgi:predicted  nucleic acid-binding Zn-ribbon protein